METNTSSSARPRKAEGLEVHILGDQCVVYDIAADRIHYLTPSAALVLELCDGARPAEEIAALLQEAYGLPAAPLDQVNDCLASFQNMALVG